MGESVRVLLTQPWTEAQHEVNALELVHPVLQRGVEFILIERSAGEWARCAELSACNRAIA